MQALSGAITADDIAHTIFDTNTNYAGDAGEGPIKDWSNLGTPKLPGFTTDVSYARSTSLSSAIGNTILTTSAQTLSGAVTEINAHLSGNVVNSDISNSAAIAYSKLALSNSIVSGDLATGAVTSTNILDETIVNSDISNSAAISGSKLAPFSPVFAPKSIYSCGIGTGAGNNSNATPELIATASATDPIAMVMAIMQCGRWARTGFDTATHYYYQIVDAGSAAPTCLGGGSDFLINVVAGDWGSVSVACVDLINNGLVIPS